MTAAARRADNYFVYKPRPNDGEATSTGEGTTRGGGARPLEKSYSSNKNTPTPTPQAAANGHLEATLRTTPSCTSTPAASSARSFLGGFRLEASA